MTRSTRIFLAMILAILPLGSHPRAAAQAPQAVLSAGGGSALPGATGITVPVNLTSESGARVAGLNFDLGFDASRVEVPAGSCNGVAVALGPAAAGAGKLISCSRPGSSSIRVIIFGFNDQIIPDGSVALVTFNVLAGAAPGTIPLSLSNAAATDPGGNPVTLSLSNGSFTVSALPNSPTATNTGPPPLTSTLTRTPTASNTPTRTQTATATSTPGGPTATTGPTASPTATRTMTVAPTHTAADGPIATAGPTYTRMPSPMITRTSAPTATIAPTSTVALLAAESATATPSPSTTATPPGMFPPELETAAAATGTALALLDQAVIATMTGLPAPEVAPPPHTGRLVLSYISRMTLGDALLLLGVLGLGGLGLATGLWLWLRHPDATIQRRRLDGGRTSRYRGSGRLGD